MTASVPRLALAQAFPCPSPDDYEANLPSGFSFKPTARIPDWQATTPPFLPTIVVPSDKSCALPTPESVPALWCSDNVAVLPDGDSRDSLMVLFTGKGMTAEEVEHLAFTSAYAGYRTIALSWDTNFTRAEWCSELAGNSTNYGGPCSESCLYNTGLEMLTGVDDPATPYPAHPLRGIYNRIALAIQYLYELDLNEDAINDHHWDDFCSFDPGLDQTVLHWGDIDVMGYSAGAQMASFISFHDSPPAPAGGPIGLFAIEGGVDFCDTLIGANPPTFAGIPPEYQNKSAYPPCGDLAFPFTDRECPKDNRFLALHQQGVLAVSTHRRNLPNRRHWVTFCPGGHHGHPRCPPLGATR